MIRQPLSHPSPCHSQACTLLTTSPSTPSRQRLPSREFDLGVPRSVLVDALDASLTRGRFAPHVYAMALYNKERAPGTQPWDGTVSRASSGVWSVERRASKVTDELGRESETACTPALYSRQEPRLWAP